MVARSQLRRPRNDGERKEKEERLAGSSRPLAIWPTIPSRRFEEADIQPET